MALIRFARMNTACHSLLATLALFTASAFDAPADAVTPPDSEYALKLTAVAPHAPAATSEVGDPIDPTGWARTTQVALLSSADSPAPLAVGHVSNSFTLWTSTSTQYTSPLAPAVYKWTLQPVELTVSIDPDTGVLTWSDPLVIVWDLITDDLSTVFLGGPVITSSHWVSGAETFGPTIWLTASSYVSTKSLYVSLPMDIYYILEIVEIFSA